MSNEYSVEAGLIVFSRDGRARIGWFDLQTGAYNGEAEGLCIADAIGAIEFHADVTH
ncbi:hypothetical protein AWB80_04154 [Caballeronia pedi]|uniref:Uncharacterized protein n=1 Tax=Caballeronia pedi TaxID=1777141 RepID=A0A158BUQ4_9BURK|nr:hypothetical protein [Caballeronia pedi]SAK73710.1 hypothetical protein AWB80_04154 [Caballeronia pedi]